MLLRCLSVVEDYDMEMRSIFWTVFQKSKTDFLHFWLGRWICRKLNLNRWIFKTHWLLVKLGKCSPNKSRGTGSLFLPGSNGLNVPGSKHHGWRLVQWPFRWLRAAGGGQSITAPSKWAQNETEELILLQAPFPFHGEKELCLSPRGECQETLLPCCSLEGVMEQLKL